MHCTRRLASQDGRLQRSSHVATPLIHNTRSRRTRQTVRRHHRGVRSLMLHWTEPLQWDQDDKDGEPKKWEGTGEEEKRH
ncbi:hypothetical protein DPEC_G00226010 [Dallia pectoralis]|uniref:Uncharacterized protein n=1 Tax=Dallia pectoralis TaxID=75939 RepID=A0ACC2G0J6_DALPE|nr:hypothetical protein DPEC_G00226010 [Dallia pectoralis]